MIQYSEEFDAYYEDETNEWIDSRCCDPSCEYCSNRPKTPMNKPKDDLVFRLNKRAEIRRQITTRKSVQENQPDRIANLLEEAAQRIATLEKNIAMMKEENTMKRTLFSIEIDIAADYPTSELAKDMSNYGLVSELIDANGPGGGNPVYCFTSYNKEDLLAFAKVCGYDDAESLIEETK
jgi:hypothetical protein